MVKSAKKSSSRGHLIYHVYMEARRAALVAAVVQDIGADAGNGSNGASAGELSRSDLAELVDQSIGVYLASLTHGQEQAIAWLHEQAEQYAAAGGRSEAIIRQHASYRRHIIRISWPAISQGLEDAEEGMFDLLDLCDRATEIGVRAIHEQVARLSPQAARPDLVAPLIPLSEDVLLLPLIGVLDSQRAQQAMRVVLEGIERHRASVVLLDVTGVQMLDSQVAGELIQVAGAARLLGAAAILTGIQPHTAETLIGLGVDLDAITTYSTLQDGIAYAFAEQRV